MANQASVGTGFSLRHQVEQASQTIHSPLGFCVLALFIVESFLFGAGVGFDLSAGWRIVAVGVGVGLFLVVFGTVVLLVIKYPKNLVFSEESHLQYDRMQIFGTEDHEMTGRMLAGTKVDVGPSPHAPKSGQLQVTGDSPAD